MLRHLLIFLGLMLLSAPYMAAVGQGSSALKRAGTPTDSIYYKDNAEKLRAELRYYRGMKATGASLTGLGAVFFVGGQSLLWTSIALNETGRRSYRPTARDPMFLGGLGATVLTAIPLAFGVPLLRYGTKQVRQLKKELH